MPRLLLNQLRSTAGLYLGCAAFTALIWVLPPQAFSARWVVAWSLVVAYIAGPAMSFRMVAAKEVALLPVSWRERWRTEWTLAVIVPLVVTTMGNVLGLAMAAAVGLPGGSAEVILLSALCDAAYVGFAAGLLTILRRPIKWRAREGPPSRAKGYLVVFYVLMPFVLVFLGGLSGALFYPFMPADLAALRGPAGWVIAAGLGTGVWTWFYWSALGPRPERFARIPSVAMPPTSISIPRESRGVGGTSGVLLRAMKKACVRAIVLATLVAPFLAFANRDMVKSTWVVLVLLFGAVDWRQQLRQLRLLPIRTMHLNLAMLSATVTLWVVTGLLMAASRFVAPSRFDGIPLLPVLTAVMCISAVQDSIHLRKSRTGQAVFMALAFALLLASRMLWKVAPSLPVQPVVFGLSLAAFAGAAILNHRTLTRSSSAYRPGPAPGLSSLGVSR